LSNTFTLGIQPKHKTKELNIVSKGKEISLENTLKNIKVYIKMEAPVRIHYINRNQTYIIETGHDDIDSNTQKDYSIEECGPDIKDKNLEDIALKYELYNAVKIPEFQDAICIEFYRQTANDEKNPIQRAQEFHTRAIAAISELKNYKTHNLQDCDVNIIETQRITVHVMKRPNSKRDNTYNTNEFSDYIVFKVEPKTS
jgi:hypothetical protein